MDGRRRIRVAQNEHVRSSSHFRAYLFVRRDGWQGVDSTPAGLASERMRAEEQVLTGDATFYEHLAAEQMQASDKWTANYLRKGRVRAHTNFPNPAQL